MRATYEEEANAAYIYLADRIDAGGVKFTYPCDPSEVHGMINLDFDAAGRLVGIEVLDARHKLPSALLEQAERLGR